MRQARECGPFVSTDESLSPVDVYFSNINLPPASIALGGVRLLNNILGQLREDDARLFHEHGIELTPTRYLQAEGRLEELQAAVLHQTWAPAPSEAVRRSWLSLGAMAYDLSVSAIMSSTRRSLETLGKQSRWLGNAPVIVYADQTRNGRLIDYEPYDFDRCETQVTPELFTACSRGGSFEAVRGSLVGRGVTGLVIDTHHISRVDRASDLRLIPDKVLEDIKNTGMPIERVHAAAGRVDTLHKDDRLSTMVELEALINGPKYLEETTMGKILAKTYEVWLSQQAGRPTSRLPITVEVPYKGLCILEDGRIGRNDFVEIHKAIAHTLHGYFVTLAA